MKDLSIVIVNWNTRDMLKDCISSVLANIGDVSYEIFVVDNASTDGSVEMIERDFPAVSLIRNTVNRGHAAANNQAIKESSGEYILLLNSDMVVLPGCISGLINVMTRDPMVKVLSAQSLSPDGTIQVSSRRFPTLKTAIFYDTVLEWWFPRNAELQRYLYRDWPHNTFGEVEQPSLTCILVKRDIFSTVGLFDEHFFIFYSDPDWFFRMKKAGIKAFFTPEAKVIHYGRASLKRNPKADLYWHRDKLFFYRKHFGVSGCLFVKFVEILDCSVRIGKILLKRIMGMVTARETIEGLRNCFSVMKG